MIVWEWTFADKTKKPILCGKEAECFAALYCGLLERDLESGLPKWDVGLTLYFGKAMVKLTTIDIGGPPTAPPGSALRGQTLMVAQITNAMGLIAVPSSFCSNFGALANVDLTELRNIASGVTFP